MIKQIAVSGVRPSGDIHIGNYLGAIKQFVEIQEKYRAFFFIADLHAITEPRDPKKLPHYILDVVALYIAAGIDPKKTTLFIQSHVPAHLELGWILSTLTPVGELNRMTQYKEKVALGKPANLGLFAYPAQMAADILLYQANVVPVGEDQVQHLELARSLAKKFNSRFGQTFTEPKAILQKESARVMALDIPTAKMSKSATRSHNYIALSDEPAEVRRKIKIAVTDSGSEIIYNTESKPGISNLLSIYSAFSGESISVLEKKYSGKNYGEFKSDLAELIIEKLSPIQKKYEALISNKKNLIKILNQGAKAASKIAKKTMNEVKAKIGLI